MSIHLSHINILNIFRNRQPAVDAPPSPQVGDVVLTRRGWYGEIVGMTDKGYSLHMLYVTQTGEFIRPYNQKQCLRWVWLSEVQS